MGLLTIADLNGLDVQDMLRRAEMLSGMYDRFIEDDEGNSAERAPGIHASEVAGCKRKIVYSLLAYEKRGRISKNWRQRFQVGHAVHRMLQNDFHAMADKSGGTMEFYDEVKISPETSPLAQKWFINSSCDGLFVFNDTSVGPYLRVGLEIKTENPDGYDKLRGPKPDHIEQAHVYMACMDVPLFWFLYINKGNQNNTPSSGAFLVQFNPHIWARMEQKFQECHDWADRVELPTREESMQCQFCSYSYTCQPPSLVQVRKRAPAWNPFKR